MLESEERFLQDPQLQVLFKTRRWKGSTGLFFLSALLLIKDLIRRNYRALFLLKLSMCLYLCPGRCISHEPESWWHSAGCHSLLWSSVSMGLPLPQTEGHMEPRPTGAPQNCMCCVLCVSASRFLLMQNKLVCIAVVCPANIFLH